MIFSKKDTGARRLYAALFSRRENVEILNMRDYRVCEVFLIAYMRYRILRCFLIILQSIIA